MLCKYTTTKVAQNRARLIPSWLRLNSIQCGAMGLLKYVYVW